MILFNYIFYRAAKFLYRYDGNEAFRSIGLVSLFQTLLIFGIVGGVSRFCFPLNETAKYANLVGKMSGVVVVVLMIINYIYYKNKYSIFEERWGESESQSTRRIRGILVILALLTPIIFILGMVKIF